MALSSALVDRARLVGAVATNYRVQGMTITEEYVGAWFRCRLSLPEANADTDTSQRRRRTIRHPTLLYGVKDSAGAPIALTIDTRVEVDSPQLGRTVWLVESDPAPLRARRRVLGYEVHLKLIDEHASERPTPARSPVGRSVGLPSEVS